VRRRRFRLFWRLVRRRIFVVVLVLLILLILFEFLFRQSVPELQYKPAGRGF
jgi:hypothetical protein